MKRPSQLLAIAACTLLFWTACNKETANPTAIDLSPFAKKFLSLNSGTMNAAAQSRNSTINQSYSGMMNAAQANAGSVGSGSDSTSTGDSTIVGGPPQSCATITEIDNSDGSHTTIYDYGTGCDNGYGGYKNLMWGKSIQTYRYVYQKSGTVITSTYLYRNRYENYGGRYYYDQDSSDWNLNGSSSYNGAFTYDTLSQDFTGWYDSSDTTDYTYGKDSYSYKSSGTSHYDRSMSVVEKNDYQYKSGDNFYSSIVTIPLVSDYTCYSGGGPFTDIMFLPTYVSGHEIIHYRQDGVEGSFEIDYGNGTCDNLITVIENGKVIIVDLGKDWAVLAVQAAN